MPQNLFDLPAEARRRLVTPRSRRSMKRMIFTPRIRGHLRDLSQVWDQSAFGAQEVEFIRAQKSGAPGPPRSIPWKRCVVSEAERTQTDPL